jgi:hypothetical protein
VLLTANVSFLAIQSVDEASAGRDPKTPAQLASYFSILACLGSMVSSVVLVILMRHREVMGVSVMPLFRSVESANRILCSIN